MMLVRWLSRPRILAIFQILVLLTCSSAAGLPRAVPAQASLRPVILQLKWTHQFQFAGYYAALEKGFYKQAGLDVKIVEGSSNVDPTQEVLRGTATFGIATSDLIIWKAKGYPVVSLAAIYQHSPMVILSNPKNGITNVHQLAGKSLMLESQNAEILAYLKSENVPIDKISLQPYSFSPERFAEGSIDATSAYLTDEPFQLSERGLDFFELNPRSSGVDFYGDCLFTSQAVIQQDPQMVKDFVKASLLGWQYALGNPSELVDLISMRYHSAHSREHLLFEAEKTSALIMANVIELGYQNPGRWQRIAETYAELGQINATVDLKAFIYDSNPPPDLTGIYLTLAGVLVVLLVTTIIAGRFYRLNKAIQREMARREEAEKLLRQMEFRYRTLVENAPFPILISNMSNGLGLYFNQHAADLFEISRDFAVGRPVEQLYANREDRQILIDRLKVSGFVNNWEVQLRKSAGKDFWANLSATLVPFDGENAIFVALLDITARKEMEKKLVDMVNIDALTGVLSRRHFLERGEENFHYASRYHVAISLFMLDVDFFKQVNDTHGHAAGDQVLKQLAMTLKKSTRASDLVGRIGGEEFGVLLLNTDLNAALLLAERLRGEIQSMRVEFGAELIQVSASIGVAEAGEKFKTIDQLMKAADEALYAAKNGGRNRVVAQGEQPAQ